jgi:steroid delta-isomerase-like uncharacterized protein
MSEANKRLVRNWFEEVWNNRNEAAIETMMNLDCRIHGLGDEDELLIGPEGFKIFYHAFRRAFPDLHVTLHEMIAEGDLVAVRWTVTMTHLGDGLGFPASGRHVSMEGSTIGAVTDGKLSEGWNHMDLTGLFAKLQSA